MIIYLVKTSLINIVDIVWKFLYKMKQKILSFIYHTEIKKFLILNMTKHPDHASEGGWFTVTGSVEADESIKDTLKREV